MRKMAALSGIFVLGAILICILPSTGLAAAISKPMLLALSSFTAKTPVPIGECAILLGGSMLVFGWIKCMIGWMIRRDRKPLTHIAGISMVTLSALLLSGALLWLPIARTAQWTMPFTHDKGALMQLCDDLLDQANALSVMQPEADAYDRLTIAQSAQHALKLIAGDRNVRIKFARYPEVFSHLNIAGIMMPWTGEAIVDGAQPLLTLPFAALHEACHQLGFGREDEANYLAYRACMNGDRIFRYSGTMYALMYTMQSVRRVDSAAWLDATQRMNERVHWDFYRMNGYENAHLTKRVQSLNAVSDVFLRLGHQAGLLSYGRVVDLLLADPLGVGAG